MASCKGSAMASTSTLEVTVISAEDLRWNRRHLERGACVTVRAGHSVVSTISDTGEAHGYSLWNEALYISSSPSVTSLQIDVGRRNQAGTSTAYVASANLPVSDFSYGPIGYKHFLSYRLRDQNGRANGIVNLCVKRMASNGDDSYNVHAPFAYGYPVPAGYASYGKY